MAKYRLTVMIDLYEDEPLPNAITINESIHNALDEFGEIRKIQHEDEYCIKENDRKNKKDGVI